MLKSIELHHDDYANESRIASIASAGFKGLDVCLYCMTTDRDESLRKAEGLRVLMEKYGLVCAQVHLPEYGLFKSSEVVDEQTTQRLFNSFEAMRLLGCRWGAYHPRSATNFGYDSKRAMKDNLDLISMLAEKADKHGAGIAIENIPIFPDCPQYRFFSADYEEHIELVDRLNAENVGICWDFGHAHLMPYDAAKMLLKLGKRIKIVHIHDNFRTMYLHIPPFLGTIDWKKAMPALRLAGYTGPLSLEVRCPLTEADEGYYKYCYDVTCALEGHFAAELDS